MLCEYFLQAERDQGMDIKVKLIMLRLFDKYLLSQTGQLYADAYKGTTLFMPVVRSMSPAQRALLRAYLTGSPWQPPQ